MNTTRRASLVALPAALLLALSGCALTEAPDTRVELEGTAACAQGHTWSVNLEDLSAQLMGQMQTNGIAATAIVPAGTQTIEWTERGNVRITSDYTLTITATFPAEGQTTTVVETHSGVTTGQAFVNGSIAIPRDWDTEEAVVSATADIDGAPQEAVPEGFTVPASIIDDQLGLELACDGTTMTVHPRGEKLTQTWTRS